MATRYPCALNIRLAAEDRERLLRASEVAEIPPATMVRRLIRQWLKTNESITGDKAQSQVTNPPAA